MRQLSHVAVASDEDGIIDIDNGQVVITGESPNARVVVSEWNGSRFVGVDRFTECEVADRARGEVRVIGNSHVFRTQVGVEGDEARIGFTVRSRGAK